MIQWCFMSSHTKGFLVSLPMTPLETILGKYSARYDRLKLGWYSGIANTGGYLINFACFMIFGPLYLCCFRIAFKEVKEAHS